MNERKRIKKLKRQKQLRLQCGNTGGIGFKGHQTPECNSLHDGKFPVIMKLSKTYLAKNSKDTAMVKARNGVGAKRIPKKPTKPEEEKKELEKEVVEA